MVILTQLWTTRPRLSVNRSSNIWLPNFLVVRPTPRSTHVVYSWLLLLLSLMTVIINFIVNIILINLICNLQRFLYRKTPKDTCNDYARCGVCCVFPRTWLHSFTWSQRQRGCQGTFISRYVLILFFQAERIKPLFPHHKMRIIGIQILREHWLVKRHTLAEAYLFDIGN